MFNYEEVKEFFDDIGKIYGVSRDDVEEAFYLLMQEYLETENVILDEKGLFVGGKLYEYFSSKEIKRFREPLEEKILLISLEKWKNYFTAVLMQNKKLIGILESQGKNNYFFYPVIEGEINKYLIIQVPKTNVKFDFEKEKGNQFVLYFPNKVRVFKKNKVKYFNKFFASGKIMTKKAAKEIINKKIVTPFRTMYSIEDFKIKYISPIKGKYGIINLVINKKISGNLLNHLDTAFKRYGYIVSSKEKNV